MFVGEFPKLSETFIINQVAALLSDGHDVDIFALRDPQEEVVHNRVEEFEMRKKCRYTSPPETHVQGALRVLSSVAHHPRYAHEILSGVFSRRPDHVVANIDEFLSQRDTKYDAHHAHFGPIGQDWQFLKKNSNDLSDRETPFVVSYYGFDASTLLEDDPDVYEELYRRGDCFTVLSSDMRENLLKTGCPSEKICYNPLGVDTEFFDFQERTDNSGEVNMLIVARLVEKKGVIDAVDAMAQIDEEIEAQLTIIGDGPRRDVIEEKIDENGLKNTVSVVGYKSLSEVRDYLYKSDMFMMPCITDSNGETSPTPTILLQAQATGIPILATEHSGIPEIVNEDSAILVPENDSTALAEAIEKLVKNPTDWSKMGKAGRQFVEDNHSIPALSERLIEIYSKCQNGCITSHSSDNH